MFTAFLQTGLLLATAVSATPSTPYTPLSGWSYHIEAAREQAWPACQYRFASFNSECNSVDLWKGAGANQEFTLVDSGDGTFYIKASCGKYLSYSSDCGSNVIDLWSEAGINQKFNIVPTGGNIFEYYLEAIGRVAAGCATRFASFPVGCTTSSPDVLDLWSATGPDQTFRIHPVSAPVPSYFPAVHGVSDFPCADPYVWFDTEADGFRLQCTGGDLGLAFSTANTMGGTTPFAFDYQGGCLGEGASPQPEWVTSDPGGRWAPENAVVGNAATEDISGASNSSSTDRKANSSSSAGLNYVFFSNTEPGSSPAVHRLGWSASVTGATVAAYTQYAPVPMDLGGQPGGEIDSTLFTDPMSGRRFLIWKSDDNNVGSLTTRIWIQEVSLSSDPAAPGVAQLGQSQVIMDSTGLWWVDSWVDGGSLVEGPEMIFRDGVYFLFFASGRYCESSYAEGVARSTSGSLFGPYEKMAVPLLSTGLVGFSEAGSKLLGPGHGALVTVPTVSAASPQAEEQLYIVFHASTSAGTTCSRYPYILPIEFEGGWPVINLA